MFTYVNQQAMGDLFRPLEHESNPVIKANQMKKLVDELAAHVYKHAAHTCYSLKEKGWSTGAISDEMQISERAVKRLIRFHSEKESLRNPLERMQGFGFEIDISHLVSRAAAIRRRSEETIHPTDESPANQ